MNLLKIKLVPISHTIILASTSAVPMTKILLSALKVNQDISGDIEENLSLSGRKNVCLIVDDSSSSSL